MDAKRITLILASTLLGAVAGLAHAEKVYKWVDIRGNVIYQDKPPPQDAERVEVKELHPEDITTRFVRPPVTTSGSSASGSRDSPASESSAAVPGHTDRSRDALTGAGIESEGSTPISGPLPARSAPDVSSVPAPGALAPPVLSTPPPPLPPLTPGSLAR